MMARICLTCEFSARYPLTAARITAGSGKYADKRTVGRWHRLLGRPLPCRHLAVTGVSASDYPLRASTECSRSRPTEAASAFTHLLPSSKAGLRYDLREASDRGSACRTLFPGQHSRGDSSSWPGWANGCSLDS